MVQTAVMSDVFARDCPLDDGTSAIKGGESLYRECVLTLAGVEVAPQGQPTTATLMW